ncbi:protein O-mannosyl-transferase 2-like [Eriocheir sinensis]|uniref:protein O-mannosyl-transferase 2-like n=1 Tax=Eriocheir sinensis TaxID=95602 RepID=UPI0021CA7836|nr:protein O-mannosyl-transferase 2-like [Eriocheir sinensis]
MTKKEEEEEEEEEEEKGMKDEETKEKDERKREEVKKNEGKERKEEEKVAENKIVMEEKEEEEEEKMENTKKEEKEEDKGGKRGNSVSSYYLQFEDAMLKFRDEGSSGGLWWAVWWAAVVAAACTRLHYITEPYNVVWDEAHFGKMVSWYINRTFYLDVHPPGGKLLLTLFGYLGGYNGTHSFASPTVPYEGYQGILAMRVGCAVLGAGMVPLGFHSVWCLTGSLTSATLAAALITFDIGSITLSKFILLDPPLMFFILASFHGLCLLHQLSHRPFSCAWWGRLAYTGLALGCVVSVKFVGVFVVSVVGLYTCLDLWDTLGDLRTPLVVVAQHFLARVLCLILLPASVYLALFAAHDALLLKAVSPHAAEEAHLSPAFQMNLLNNALNNVSQPKELAYGSLVTLRTNTLAGVYLHSHNLTYPGEAGAKGWQQVTGFRAKDHNNYFRILFPEDDPEQKDGFYSGAPEYVAHGDWVRLYHPVTGAALSCSKNRSFVTKKHSLVYTKPVNLTNVQQEETPLGMLTPPKGTSSASITPWQMWQVVVEGGGKGQTVHTLSSSVKFLCVANKCALTWSRAKLPIKWGGGQAEITCSTNLQEPYTNWIVEQHYNPYLPNATYEHLRAGFASRVVETHRVMTWINSRLKPEGSDRFNSHRPWMWPACLKSQVWYDVSFRIVLLGNPIIFWINLVTLLAAPAMLLHHYFTTKRRRRPQPPHLAERKSRQVFALRWLLIAYLFHYLPFYTMDRILYYHHYFPALQFSSMLTAVVVGYLLDTLHTWMSPARARHAFTWGATVFLGVLVISFRVYCYVGYGHPTVGGFNPDNSTFRAVRAFEAWEI